MKVFVYRKTIKIYNLVTFPCMKVAIFHTFCLYNKKTNMVTPQFYLSFRKGMPNTTKYSRSRKKKNGNILIKKISF